MSSYGNVALRTKRIRVATITAAWLLVSLLLFAYAHLYLVVSVPGAGSADTYSPGYNLVAFVAVSLLFGITYGYAMVFWLPRRIRRKSFSYGIAFNALLVLVLFLVVVLVVSVVLSLAAHAIEGEGEVLPALVGNLTNPATLITMFMWALMVAATQFVLQVSDKFGQGVLWDFVRGRYFRPVQVERIFLFLDLKSSTTIAEALGHIRYFEFLAEFVADITEPIVEHGGEIYQYVGDEVVVSWPLLDRAANGRCLTCFFAAVSHLRSLEPEYVERFGVAPAFRGGMHAGTVTAGEIGVVRKEIVFSGDVLNTAARIQAECKDRGLSLVASGPLLEHVESGPGFRALPLGVTHLRGREQALSLFSIEKEP